MTSSLGADRRKTAPSVSGKGGITWRPCEEDLSIWRMLCVGPDRELFATIDLARAELLSFEVEWDDGDGVRRFVAWSVRRGFSVGSTDSESTDESIADHPKVLGMALVIVEDAGIGSPVAGWMMDRLSSVLGRP